jgi:FecR protein
MMGTLAARHALWITLLIAAILAGTVGVPSAALAQVQDGATMTVLRGQVAVVRGDGSAVQPTPSGTVVRAGDEIRTLTRSGAAITFFAGTEIELGEETTLAIERAARDGDRIDIALRQVFGVSLHRVHALTDPASSYRVEVGGAVAVVRGTDFLIYGPTDENVVGMICLDDCTEQTTFGGCPMGPNVAYWLEVDRRQVVSACQPFAAKGDIWNAPDELRLRERQRR